MAERKSGPVKPPVIDLKPNETGSDDAGDAEGRGNGAGAGEAGRPAPPRPQARLAMPWSAILIAAAGGAVLGTVLTYLLVNVLPLPDQRQPIADPAPVLAELTTVLEETTARLDGLEARLATAEDAATANAAALTEAREALDTDVAALREELAALPVPEPVDLDPLTAQLATLEDRVSAIGAGASGADAAALAGTLSGLNETIAGLEARIAALGTRLSERESGAAALRSEIETLKAAVAAQATQLETAPSATDVAGGDEATVSGLLPAVRLPLLVSGLDGAFAAGRPYAALLERLETLLPALDVPSPVLAAADAGLPRPDAVAARFRQAVPQILARRAAESSGDLGQDALEWLKGTLALRPSSEMEGDTPEAIVSRLEAAVDRHDFATATTLLAALPEPMQDAAAGSAADMALLAQAGSFIDALRSTALADTLEATP